MIKNHKVGPDQAGIQPPGLFIGNYVPRWEASSKVCNYVVEHQISRLAICLETSWQTIELVLGTLKAGIPVCMLSTKWPAALVDRALERLAIKHVITTRTDLCTRRIDPSSCSSDRIVSDNVGYVPKGAATIMHTSGSTAEPKAVLHFIEQHLFSARSVCSRLMLSSTDRWLLNLPLWHVSGMSIVFRCSRSGAKLILPEQNQSLLEELTQKQITHVSMVATQLIQVADQVPPASLRVAIVGGGPIPGRVLDKARTNGWPILTTYGMTETSSMVTLSDQNSPPGSSGYALPGNELQIDPEGEILVRSPAVCAGYLFENELQSVVDDQKWLHTGDLGKLDEKGELHVFGRKDHVFISGGENISPEEIESVLYKYPGVHAAVVVPVPHDTYGHRPVTFIQGAIEFKELAEFLHQELPKFKIPMCYSWPETISSSAFKDDRKSLTNLAIQLQNRSADSD